MQLKTLLSASFLVLTACAVQPQPPVDLLSMPPLPQSAFAEEEVPLSPAQLREDLTALYEGLQEAHYDLFAKRSRSEYDALYQTLLASLEEPMMPSEAVFVFQRFAAFGNIAHSRVEGGSEVFSRYREASGTALPLFPRVRGERMFVADSYVPGIQAGDEILEIAGLPISEWLPRLYRNISADSDYLSSTILELTFPQTLWMELGSVDTVEILVRADGGRTSLVTAEMIDRDTLLALPDNPDTEIFTFDGYAREAELLDDRIAYLKPGPFFGMETPENVWDTSVFWSFIDTSFEEFLAADAQALIIDLRQNPGGDNSFSDRIISWFADEPFKFASEFRVRSSAQSNASNQARIDLNPASLEGASGRYAEAYKSTPYGETFEFEIAFSRPREGARFRGPVYAIVDRYSFSNAVSTAALLQDYGFATIVGEETADLATTYGAMETFRLQNSNLVVGFPKALITRPSGDLSDRGVVPDVIIEAPVFSSSDTLLEDAIGLVRSDLAQTARSPN